MAPIKAALDSSLAFLAKSFSRVLAGPFQRRGPGPAEDLGLGRHPGLRRRLSLRRAGDSRARKPVQTEEVANVAAFLLSPRSSGINAQRIVVDAGMAINYFDRDVIRRVRRVAPATGSARAVSSGHAAEAEVAAGRAICPGLLVLAGLCCQWTPSMSTLMPEPMPSRATLVARGQVPVFDAHGGRHAARPPSRCCPAAPAWNSRSRRSMPSAFEEQLAMGAAHLVAEGLVDLVRAASPGQRENRRRPCGRRAPLRCIRASESVHISGWSSLPRTVCSPPWHKRQSRY